MRERTLGRHEFTGIGHTQKTEELFYLSPQVVYAQMVR